MAIEQEEQFIVWQRYIWFRQMGMKESYLMLFNGWLVMDYVRSYVAHLNESFLTNKFLER